MKKYLLFLLMFLFYIVPAYAAIGNENYVWVEYNVTTGHYDKYNFAGATTISPLFEMHYAGSAKSKLTNVTFDTIHQSLSNVVASIRENAPDAKVTVTILMEGK